MGGTPPASGDSGNGPRQQQANLAVVPWAPTTTATAAMAVATPSPVPSPPLKWDHIADDGGSQEAAFVSAVPGPPSYPVVSPPFLSGPGGAREALANRSRFRDGPPSGYALLAPQAQPEGMQALSLCRCLLKVETEYAGKPFRIVIDTGATVNLIRRDRLEPTVDPVEVSPVPVTTVTGATEFLKQQVTLLFDLNAFPYMFDFYVAERLPADALLGIDGIVEAGWIIDVFRRCLYHLTHAIPPVPLAPCPHTIVLAYAATQFVLPPRAWKRVPVRANPQAAALPEGAVVLLTPSPPPQLTVHGAPIVMLAATPTPCVLLCNHGDAPLNVEVGSPLATQELCDVVVKEQATESSEEERQQKGKVRAPQWCTKCSISLRRRRIGRPLRCDS